MDRFMSTFSDGGLDANADKVKNAFQKSLTLFGVEFRDCQNCEIQTLRLVGNRPYRKTNTKKRLE
jgi:hypothetical protein